MTVLDKLFMSDSSTALSHFRNYEKAKVSDQEFERRLGNKELSKGGAPETSGLLRKKGPTPLPGVAPPLRAGPLARCPSLG